MGQRDRIFELSVSIAILFLPVGGKEVRPAGQHVAGQVQHQGDDAVGFRVEPAAPGFARHLAERAITVLPELGEALDRV